MLFSLYFLQDLEVAGPAGTEASSPGTVTREAGSLAAANGSPRNLSPREMDGVADRPASKTVDMPLEAPTSLVAPDSQQEMQELLFKVGLFFVFFFLFFFFDR